MLSRDNLPMEISDVNIGRDLVGDVFRTLSNIYDGVFSEAATRLVL